ncbi:antibiotic biosynthesis monooxygenase, partial [Staphylococcus arlettae]
MLNNEMHRIYLDANNNEVTINRFNVAYKYT